MKIRFECSGGLAGIHTSVELDSISMSSEELKQIRELIKSSNFFNLPPESLPPKRGSADYLNYKVTIETEEAKHTIHTNDITMPTEIEPLINFLQEKSRSEKSI
jgi:emfourin